MVYILFIAVVIIVSINDACDRVINDAIVMIYGFVYVDE